MTQQRSIRVILIDDHLKVHRAISAYIALLDDVELIAQGSNGEEAIELCAKYQPDVVLMDVIMPGMGGIEATQKILEQFSGTKILALSSFQDTDSIRAMIDAGAAGYLLKDASIDDLADTLRTVLAGRTVFSSEVTEALVHPNSEPVPDYGLTPRELEVLNLMVRGLNNREISEALYISQSTAKFHASSILGKLNVSSRVEAVALAVEQRLIS